MYSVVPCIADDSLKGTLATVNKPLSEFVQLNNLDFNINIARKIVPPKTEAFPLTDRSDPYKGCTWEHTYGGILDDRARTITAIDDGVYVVAGFTQSKGASEGDSWVIKINENGRLLWEQTFGGDGEDGIFQIKALPDGSLFATGYSDLGGSAGFDLRVLKINKNGRLIWERIFGKSAFDSVPLRICLKNL